MTLHMIWHDWLKENQTEEYKRQTTQKEGVANPPTGVKQESYQYDI